MNAYLKQKRKALSDSNEDEIIDEQEIDDVSLILFYSNLIYLLIHQKYFILVLNTCNDSEK